MAATMFQDLFRNRDNGGRDSKSRDGDNTFRKLGDNANGGNNRFKFEGKKDDKLSGPGNGPGNQNGADNNGPGNNGPGNRDGKGGRDGDRDGKGPVFGNNGRDKRDGPELRQGWQVSRRRSV